MRNRVRSFKKDMQSIAWDMLQTEIDLALSANAGEYDFPAIVDACANFMRRQYGTDYTQVLNYLEARYDASFTN